MGHSYVTASASILTQPGMLTSVLMSPDAAATAATLILYDATAATANTEIMRFECGTSAQTVSWSDHKGIEFDNLYVAVANGDATIVWD